jgi:hypothetical protein
MIAPRKAQAIGNNSSKAAAREERDIPEVGTTSVSARRETFK